MRALLSILLITCASVSWASGNQQWLANYDDIINQQFVCTPVSQINDRSPCNYFVVNILRSGFELNDFITNNTVMSANEISNYVRTAQQWRKIGSADQQSALQNAQLKANLGYPVIAVETSHIALIIPGQMSRSGSWGLNVPNSASFSLDDVSRSYSSKPLSYAWQSSDKNIVQLYWRQL